MYRLVAKKTNASKRNPEKIFNVQPTQEKTILLELKTPDILEITVQLQLILIHKSN